MTRSRLPIDPSVNGWMHSTQAKKLLLAWLLQTHRSWLRVRAGQAGQVGHVVCFLSARFRVRSS